jgi:hypothetical protein
MRPSITSPAKRYFFRPLLIVPRPAKLVGDLFQLPDISAVFDREHRHLKLDRVQHDHPVRGLAKHTDRSLRGRSCHRSISLHLNTELPAPAAEASTRIALDALLGIADSNKAHQNQLVTAISYPHGNRTISQGKLTHAYWSDATVETNLKVSFKSFAIPSLTSGSPGM